MTHRFFALTALAAFIYPGISVYAQERPRAPLAGFTPLVAVSLSNERRGDDFNWEHTLRSTYSGSPIAGNPATNYTIGVLDTGASVDLIGRADAANFGINSSRWLTPNFAPLSGSAGQVDAPITQPLGFFAQGVSAIDGNGRLDTSQLVGHSNVSAVVIPENGDESLDIIPTVVGIPMLTFYNSIIRNDRIRTVEFNGEMTETPDVEIVPQSSFNDSILNDYSRSIPMTFSPIATTASYSGLNFGDPLNPEPQTPTLLSLFAGTIPTGGSFFANVNLGQGELSPTNPIRELTMLVDTGAEASIISQGVAANLNLDLRNPDFEIDVAGIGGLLEDVPGFYVDFTRINASGGAMEWDRAPFVVLDLPSPEGGTLDGVLGMNLFWNRNVIFQPDLTGSSFFHVSDPLYGPEVLLGDVDFDLDLDAADIDLVMAARGGDFETADPAIYDLDRDNVVGDGDVAELVEMLIGSNFGDANLDLTVDLTDFQVLKEGFGASGDELSWADGDFNGDKMIDLTDFGALKANFGKTGGGSEALVPEPGAMVLALLGAAGGWFVVRRRGS